MTEKGEAQMKRTLAILLALVLLCAFFFVAAEAEHDCAGENCAVCALLNTCLRVLRLSFLCAAALLAVELTVMICGIRPFGAAVISRFSPVLHKVKLSN